MSDFRYDGSIESSNTPTSKNTFHRKDYATYRCIITEVYFTNNISKLNMTQNSNNPQVLYEAVILGGFKEGQIISNIRMANLLGGKYNYEERILRKTSKKLLQDRLKTHDGDIVYITFNQGDPTAPIIIGCAKSFLNKTDSGATEEDGPRMVSQYNGIHENINKDGEFLLTRKGGQYNETKGYFIPVDSDENEEEDAEAFQAKFHLLSNKMLWEDPQSSILFEKDEKKYTLSVGKDDDGAAIYTEVIDSVLEKTTVTFTSGLVITTDGAGDKVEIVTSGGATLKVDGDGDIIEVEDSAGGKLKISGGKVGLGGTAAETIDIISQTLELLATDLGNLGYPLANAAAYAALKILIDSIKGGI